jgi:hypothetical protein
VTKKLNYESALAAKFRNQVSAGSGMLLPFDPASPVVERNFSKVLWLDLNAQS